MQLIGDNVFFVVVAFEDCGLVVSLVIGGVRSGVLWRFLNPGPGWRAIGLLIDRPHPECLFMKVWAYARNAIVCSSLGQRFVR
jgi:hypothetical protein